MKKIFLILMTLFLTISSAQSEQWIYIKEIPNIADAAAILLDLDSIEYDDIDNSISFNIKKYEDYSANSYSVYVHKMKYLYKSKQFAILESTKYLAWVAPENKVLIQTFEHPQYKSSTPNSLSERLEMLISDRDNLENMKGYINSYNKLLRKKLARQLKKLDEVNIRFWIDGNGNIYSYEYMFGNRKDVQKYNITNYNNNLLHYAVDIECFPEQKKGKWKIPTIHVYKNSFNPISKESSYSYMEQIVSSTTIESAMLPNMSSMARTVYQTQMSNDPASYGKLPNKDFFDNFMTTMLRKDFSAKQKKMAIQVLSIQSLNYNEKLNAKLKTINQLKSYSNTYNKGVVGIVLKLK